MTIKFTNKIDSKMEQHVKLRLQLRRQNLQFDHLNPLAVISENISQYCSGPQTLWAVTSAENGNFSRPICLQCIL
ncbi:hypothetical protein T05_1837 [Trichinella murrelli]|uniref:Uncharacterized protein n=1 Tax=Trichinella murrelli TaxID=144512 RepID=A0A0V0TGH6_9BILA|nr:hypothetical protein T05_1837 [Trichinella murrelli]